MSREFEFGAWYPTLTRGRKNVVMASSSQGLFIQGDKVFDENEFDWIGEKLPERYWDKK